MRAVIVAACVAFVLTLFGTPLAIRAFIKLRAAQPIRDINTSHASKRGTPTMGGVVFIVGTVIAYFAGHLVLKTLPEQQIVPPGPTVTGLVLLGLMVFSGGVGFPGDDLQGTKRNSLRLHKRGKRILQLGGGAVFEVADVHQRVLLPGARSARSGPDRRRGGRGLCRLPVVERVPGPDLHGRYRLHGARWADRRDGDGHPYRVAAARARSALRDHHDVADHPDHLVPYHR